MTSPGYDARLQESRKALSNSPVVVAPTNPTAPAPKPSKKKHPN